MEINTKITTHSGSYDVVYRDVISYAEFDAVEMHHVAVYAFCDGKLVLVRDGVKNTWTPPGGHIEAGESSKEAEIREIKEETNLDTLEMNLIGVYEFFRMNQVIIAFHAHCEGDVKLSPELAEYKLFDYDDVMCWPAGTGYALADWLRSRGHEPKFMDMALRV